MTAKNGKGFGLAKKKSLTEAPLVVRVETPAGPIIMQVTRLKASEASVAISAPRCLSIEFMDGADPIVTVEDSLTGVIDVRN